MALQSSALRLVYLIVQVGRESLELLLPVAMLMVSLTVINVSRFCLSCRYTDNNAVATALIHQM